MIDGDPQEVVNVTLITIILNWAGVLVIYWESINCLFYDIMLISQSTPYVVPIMFCLLARNLSGLLMTSLKNIKFYGFFQ